MHKKMWNRIVAVLLAGVLMIGFVPLSALADENIPGSDPSDPIESTQSVDTEQNVENPDADSNPLDVSSQSGDSSQPGDSNPPENTVPSEDQPQPDTAETLQMPDKSASLNDIIAADDEGSPQIYTTLYDANYNVISTNDPKETQDSSYSSGGTVDKGSSVYIRFRLAKILPHDGNNGVQEDVTYYLNGLPEELIPKQKDEAGNQIVDPETPVEFFRTAGDLEAYGGIYTDDEKYQLKVFFRNVEDEIDISGSFQYRAKLSDMLEPGQTYYLKDVPGGTLSFTVTPPETPPVSTDGYSLSLTGGSSGPTAYYWCAQLSRNSDSTGDELPFSEMTITSDDAVGVWVNENDGTNLGIFNAYGDNAGPRFTLYASYTGEDSQRESLTASPSDVTQDDCGTTVHFKGVNGNLQVDVQFRRSDAIEGTQSNSGGKWSYITNTIHATISDGNGGPAKNIANLTLYVPTITYDDYERTGTACYNGRVSVNNEISDVSMNTTGQFNTDYDSLGTPGISSSAYDPDYGNSYEYLPARYYSYVYSNGGYRGNYYWMEYDPAVENTLGANYYIPNKTFSGGSTNNLSDQDNNGQKATFSSQNAGTVLHGMVDSNLTNWEYLGTVSVSQVQGDSNLLGNASCFMQKGYTGDAKFQYQLKQVFKDATGSGNLVIYRSQNPHSYGEYVYLVVDPQTNAKAQQAKDKNWYEYMEMDGSAKPAGWRIHIFNAPCSSMYFSMFPSLGAFSVNDQNGSGSITDQVKVGIANNADAEKSNRAAYSTGNRYNPEIYKYQSSLMNARWVDDHTIFWTMTFDASCWQKWSTGYLYAKVDSSQQPGSRYSNVTIDGQTMSSSALYALNPKTNQWKSIASGCRSTYDSNGGIDKLSGETSLAPGENENIYCYSYGNGDMMQFRNDDSKDITIGFFTHVEGEPNSNYKHESHYDCTAEFVVQTGDVSRFAGYNGNSFPTYAAGDLTQYPFRVTASAQAVVPDLYKNGSVQQGGDSNKTSIDWMVTPYFPSAPYSHTNSPIISEYYGGYNGVLSIADSMSEASARDIAGNEISVQPGKYTYVTKMLQNGISISEMNSGGGCGPLPYADGDTVKGDTSWQRYVDGRWESTNTPDTCWSPKEPGIYRRILTTGFPNTEQNPMAVYVYYAGNMADSVASKLSSELDAMGLNPSESRFAKPLVVEYRGLIHAVTNGGTGSLPYPIAYTTETDNMALLDAANEASGKEGLEAQTALYDLLLSNSASCGMWEGAQKEPVIQTVNKRMSAMLSIQKTADSPRKNVGDTADTGVYTLSVVNGLTYSDYIDVEDFITGFANVQRTADNSITAVEGGTFTDDTAIKALVDHLALNSLNIKANISQQKDIEIYQNGRFAEGWTASTIAVATDASYQATHAGSLFKITLKKDEGQIPAGAEFIISYKTTLNMDTAADGENTFRQSNYYTGEGLQIFNNAEATRTYTPLSGTQRMARAAAVNKDMTLTVDCGDVSSVYLMKNKLVKEGVENDDTMHWMYYTYTGTMGKDTISIPLDDYLRYEVQDGLTFIDSESGQKVKLTDVPEAERERIRMLVEHLVERHTVYNNIKVYYTDAKPTISQEPDNSKLIWDLKDLTLSGGTDVTGGTVTKDGLRGLTLGDTPDGVKREWSGTGDLSGVKLILTGSPASLCEDDDEAMQHSHTGFRIDAEGLKQEKYLVSTYDVTVDWDAVHADIQKILGNYSAKGRFVNEVSDDTGEKADSKGAVITVEDATLAKTVSNVDSKAGTANWTLTAKTGSKNESQMKLTDTANIKLPDGAEERIKTAAEAAVYIDPASVKITLGSGAGAKTIYENQKSADDWTDNITVTAEDRHLEVVVKNTESSKQLLPGQTYTVTYSTGLDKNRFLENGGKSTDTFTLENAATFTYGDLSTVDTRSADFEPDLPITAEKTGAATGNMVTWTASASTGAGVRKDFALRDTLTTPDAGDASDVLAAMKLQSMQIEVKTGTADPVVYSINTLPEGAKLTTLDGKMLEADKLGFTGFVLCFESLPADTTVNVKYVTSVNRDAYGKDEKRNLQNLLEVSSADGATAKDTENAQIEVKKPLEKQGSVTTKNGKAWIDWTLNVNLTETFTQTELEKMTEAAIADVLSPVLKLDEKTVAVKDPAGNDVPYTVEIIGTKLAVHLSKPAEHPSVVLTFRTECLAGVSGLVNQAELSVDGKTVEKTESPDIGKVEVGGQYGTIQASKIPVFTPEAWKYVDNQLCTENGKYSFQITEVDENGGTINNGHVETVYNDDEGKIPFSTIKYTGEGTHYYQVKETGAGTLDTRVFTIRVDVQKVTVGYTVSSMILSPENYATVRFDNTVKPRTTDFTVTKVWKDGDNAGGMRPDKIVVWLYQGDEPYNNMTVTLNESNNWTYTWHNLPVAGGDYHAVEEPVPGYDGTAMTQNGETVLTNTVSSGRLTIEKTVAGSDSDVNRDFVFTVTLTDANGIALSQRFRYTGSKEGTITSGEQITLKHGQSITIENLPENTYYKVEEAAVTGYQTTVSDDSGQVHAGENPVVRFLNRSGEDMPGNSELTITKSVTGKGGDHNKLFTFSVTLKDAEERPLVGSYTYTGSKTGSITNGGSIKLKDGESVTIIGLPDNVQYSVEEIEANQDGYTTSASNAAGTISAGGSAKAQFINDKSESDKTRLTVRKEWKDSGESRPDYVLVQLLRDGKAYGEPVYLRNENGWQYTWSDLDQDNRWSVEEVQVPDGYQVSVSYDGDIWVITNTKKTDTPPVTPNTPGAPNTGDTSNLALWIALLFVSGGAAIGIAVAGKKKKDNK